MIVLLNLSKEPPCASQDSVYSFDNELAAETPGHSEPLNSSASVQKSEQSLKNLFQWDTLGKPPSTQELQGLRRATWHLDKEFRSLKIFDDVLCREFIHKG